MQEIIERWISEGVTGLTAALLAWFFTRRQSAATVESLELDLTDRAITIWRNQSENLWEQVGRIRVDLDTVTRENETLKREVERLTRDNVLLRKRLTKYEKNHEGGGE